MISSLFTLFTKLLVSIIYNPSALLSAKGGVVYIEMANFSPK